LKRVMIFGIIFIVLLTILIITLNIYRNEDTGVLILSGIIEAEENDVSFRMPGLITHIYFDEGDYIDSGAVIAELDRNELNAAVDQTSKNYEAAKAAIVSLEVNLETINRNLNKISKLIAAGAATQTQYDDLFDQKRQTEAQLNYSQKSLEAAKAAVDMANIRLDYAVLKTYAKGRVLSRMFEPGEVVMPAAPVATIADLDNLTIKVYLPESCLGAIKLGQNVAIQIDSHPEKTFPGTITHISDKAEFTPKNIQTKKERVKQVFAVKIASYSHDGILKPGLPCDVVISIPNK